MCNLYRKMWIAAGIMLCLLSVVYAYSGGTGEPNTPYQIGTVADWQQLMDTPNDWNKPFIMTDDIDLQGVSLTPVGNSAKYFTGVFDGNGFIIYNPVIRLDSNSYVGLFGYVGYVGNTAGRIRNLGVEDANIIAKSYVGGLVGYNYHGGIANCFVTGKVYASTTYCGGLTGRNDDGNVIDCYSTCSVKGLGNYVGGLVGSVSSGDVNTSYSTGSVTGNDTYVGGLTGYNYGNIINSYAKGDVNGPSNVGGLIGCITGGSVKTCYSVGEVNGTSNVGGLIGRKTAGTVDVNSFWDVNTSGKSTSAGGTGKTTAEMKDPNTFLNARWDFTTPVWEICNGTNYPKLAWQIPLLGDFTCPDGVDLEDLAYLVQRWLDTNCAATNDCDRADIYKDENDIVNFLDFALLAENWMTQ